MKTLLTPKVLSKILLISKNIKTVQRKNLHFSFLIRKNNIISVGWNNYYKTHPIAKRFDYHSQSIHSELACLLNCNRFDNKTFMVNIRTDKRGELMLSKPCESCQKMLFHHRIFQVIYSTESGFECFTKKTTIIG